MILFGTGVAVAVGTGLSELASEAVAVISGSVQRDELDCLQNESYPDEQIRVNEEIFGVLC